MNISVSHSTLLTNDNIREHACEDLYSGGALKFFYITKSAVVDYAHLRGTYNMENSLTECIYTQPTLKDLAGNCFVTSKIIGIAPCSYNNANIDFVGDVDYYAFNTSSEGNYTFSATTPNAIPLLAILYDDQENILYSQTSETGNISFSYLMDGSSEFVISFSSPAQSEHFLSRIYNFSVTN